MALNHIKNAFEKNIDSHTHHSFIRYSLGEFSKEPFIIKVGSAIKIWGSFEYVNVFARLLARLAKAEISVSGTIPTVKDIKSNLENSGLNVDEKRRTMGKKGMQYMIQGNISPEKAQKLFEELSGCYLLVDLSSGSLSMKVKKKETPKIGSPSDKFATLTLPKEFLKDVIDEFLFDHDIESFKDAEIMHKYRIDDIKVDEKLVNQEPNRAREEAVRKGVIKRLVKIDGEEYKSEFDFSA